MSHHTGQHCKPLTECHSVFKLARRYVHLHKRFRYLLWFIFFVVNAITLLIVHEIMVHFGLLAAFTVWDGLVLAVEE